MEPKEELKLMSAELAAAGKPTVFKTDTFYGRTRWEVSVLSNVDDRGKVAVVGFGFGLTEEDACRDCLDYWARTQKNSEVPNAGSLEELRLKMSIGGHT